MKKDNFMIIKKEENHIYFGDIAYPLGTFDKKLTLFIGDISPYKSWFGKYPTPDKTCKKVNTGKYDIEEVKKWLDLNSEERMYRSWWHLSLGVRWRATTVVGVLSEKKYYSLPIGSDVNYWIIGAKQGVWDKLAILGYEILVSEEDCEWLNEI
jgi:hypothetical protein